jgi:hypothetical protein
LALGIGIAVCGGRGSVHGLGRELWLG